MIFPKLFIPGPTQVDAATLQAMAQPQVGHRTAEFSELMGQVVAGLQRVLNTTGRVFLFSNPATGVWEAAVRNSVKKGALNCVNGAFSAKWHTVTKACGLPCDVLEKEWGSSTSFGPAVKPEDVDRALASGKFDVVTLVHNETSTGVMSPLEDIAAMMAAKYPDVLLQVDAVSSMAGVEIKVDDWQLGTCFASLQKAWGLPAGFTVCAVSERAMERSREMTGKGYYFDFEVLDKFYSKMQTPSTPSLPHMFGLAKVLKDIEQETLAGRYARHREMAAYARQWALDHGQQLFPEPGYESVTMTAVRNVQEWPLQAIFEALEGRGYRMDRGYGKLQGQVFRVAHMGSVMMEDLKEYLNVFDQVLATLEVAV